MHLLARLFAAALVLVASVPSTGHTQAPSSSRSVSTKMALVIGNADYDGNGVIDMSQTAYDAAAARHFAPDLANPINDARLIRDVLTRSGYSVTYAENLDREHLAALLQAFGNAAGASAPDTRVVVYYAGHAVKVELKPYFVPVQATVPAKVQGTGGMAPSPIVEAGVSVFAIPISALLSRFTSRANGGFNLVIWDACRYNPWYAQMERAFLPGMMGQMFEDGSTVLPAMPDNSAVVFSAKREALDGEGEPNSPFAAALALYLGRERLLMRDMLRGTDAAMWTTTQGRQQTVISTSTLMSPTLCVVSCSTP